MTERFQKSTCDAPIHDHSGLSKRVELSLFGVALVTVACRFAARIPSLGGAGLGLDDWTILACVILLLPLTVICNLGKPEVAFHKQLVVMAKATTDVNAALEYGLGKDIWTLSPDQINNVLFVSRFATFSPGSAESLTTTVLLGRRGKPLDQSSTLVISSLVTASTVGRTARVDECKPAAKTQIENANEHWQSATSLSSALTCA